MPTNDGGHVIDIYFGPTVDEMAALDSLGPLTRQALCDAPIRYSASAVLKQIKDYEEELRQKAPPGQAVLLDPRNPRLDEFLARGVVEDSVKTMLKDRSEYDALLSVQPLRANISVKSIREQRRSLRSKRW